VRDLYRYSGSIGILARKPDGCICVAGPGLPLVERTVGVQADGGGTGDSIDYAGAENQLFVCRRGNGVAAIRVRLRTFLPEWSLEA